MAATPTILELYNDTLQSLETKLGDSIPTFGKRFLPVLASVQAAKMKLYWLAIARIQKNIFVDTADSEENGGTLERFARVKLNRERFAATQGEYTVQVTGTITEVIPAGTLFKSNDDSSSPEKIFTNDTAKTLTSNPDTMTIRALEAGVESRLIVGDKLTATSPLLNIEDEVEVTVEDVIPLAEEDIEELREKTVAAFQTEAQGGSGGDYRNWAGDAQGVAKVYPYSKAGEASAINLYVEATKVDSSDGFGTPTAQTLLDVEDVVNLDPDSSKPTNERGRRPTNAKVYYIAVTVKPVVITVVNGANIEAADEIAIETAVESLIDSVRPYIASVDLTADKKDILDINRVIQTIQGVLSGNQKFDSITMTVDGTPVTTSTVFTDGDIPYLSSITF